MVQSVVGVADQFWVLESLWSLYPPQLNYHAKQGLYDVAGGGAVGGQEPRYLRMPLPLAALSPLADQRYCWYCCCCFHLFDRSTIEEKTDEIGTEFVLSRTKRAELLLTLVVDAIVLVRYAALSKLRQGHDP